ncbi:hypothetical protein DL93DRAFT_2090704 [Clavulina sp. PMI_390]|nr:hypothetical protein DL93DRAFT_2090704 [Clavulina sp. PMI_390]
MVHKTTRTESDFDLELGLRGASSDRDSAYTVDTDSIVESSSKGYIPAPPVSPGTAAATNFMRPQSTMHHGVYETKSELVTAIPGADGRRIMISTPQPALYGIGGRLERPGSALSGSRKTSEDDAFFPGR